MIMHSHQRAEMIERQNSLPITYGTSCRFAALALVLLSASGQVAAQETVREKSSSAPEQITTPAANGDASQGYPTTPAGSGMILVSKQPIKLLAGPSSSAAAMYGFPAGRRFRLIGQESGFAQIQDVKSGAKGWIDEASLGQLPGVPVAPAASEPKEDLRTPKEMTVSIPSNATPTWHTHIRKIASTPSKTKHPHPHKAATAKTQSATSASEPPKRRGLFGLRRNSAQGVLY
jgi:hypothetical protein